MKKLIKRLIQPKPINTALRSILQKFPQLTRKYDIRYLFPVSGIISFPLPKSKKILLESDDGEDLVLNQMFWDGFNSFEFGTVELFIKMLKNANVVLDVGANVGVYGLIAAITNDKTQVYCFEPNPRILEYLKRNIEINKVSNIKINTGAVTNFDGEITLYIPNSLKISTEASTLKGFREDSTTAVTVPALKLDSFVRLQNIGKVDLIKTDTEGTEHLVLEGAQEILQKHQPVIFCEVLKGRCEKELETILKKYSYRYFHISKSGLIRKTAIEGDDRKGGQFNWLFVPERKLQYLDGLTTS